MENAPVVDESNGLEKALLASEGGTTAEIYLHGAHITSFKPAGQQEVLFVSKEAIFKPPKAIRGGVPVCWPQFNDMGPGQAHGFARNTAFEVAECTKDSVDLVLRSSESTQELFPGDFEVHVAVKVTDENGGTLNQTFTCENKGSMVLKTTLALHTYFCVSAIANASVQGLEGCSYYDNLDGRKEKAGTAQPVTIAEEVDRIYADTGDIIVLKDGGAGREVVLHKEGFSDVVVWNPWIDKAAKTKDFGDEEYKEMLCLEAANAAVHLKGESVAVEPGQVYKGEQSMFVRPL